MSESKYILCTHTHTHTHTHARSLARSKTVLTRSPGPQRKLDMVIIYVYIPTHSLNRNKSHKIDCILPVQTFDNRYTEKTVEVSKHLQKVLSRRASQL